MEKYPKGGYDPRTDEVNPIQLNKFKPLGPWAYFGYSLLYCIPLIGLIFLIIFSFNDNNRNRRNHARSYWCALLFIVIIVGIILLITLISGINFGQILKGLVQNIDR